MSVSFCLYVSLCACIRDHEWMGGRVCVCQCGYMGMGGSVEIHVQMRRVCHLTFA